MNPKLVRVLGEGEGIQKVQLFVCAFVGLALVVVWAVVDVFVSQLSVPPQVAQTVGPQKHQQRPTKTAAHSMLTW